MTPRFTKIIWTDWPALFCGIAIAVIWSLCAARPLIWPWSKPGTIIGLAVAVSLFATCVLVWRVARIYRLFARGLPARARIQSVQLFRDRGRLEFDYELGGKRVSSWMPVHQSKDVLAMRVGQEVDALVDPQRPANAIVRQLYE